MTRQSPRIEEPRIVARPLSGSSEFDAWDRLAAGPGGHLHQSTWWARPLLAFGVHHDVVALEDQGTLLGGAMIRSVTVPYLGLTLSECLSGPVVPSWDAPMADVLLAGLDELANENRTVQITLRNCPDPAVHRSLTGALTHLGARWTSTPVLDHAVVALSDRSIDDVRHGYHQNTRRSVRRGRNGPLEVVRLRAPAELEGAYQAFLASGRRQGFPELRPWEALGPMLSHAAQSGRGETFGAVLDGEVVAAIFVSYAGDVAEYVYGGYLDHAAPLRPNHLLHDEAIEAAINRSKIGYNLGMLPEAGRTPGLTRFKLGFGAQAHQVPDTITWQCRPALARLVARARAAGGARRLSRPLRKIVARRYQRSGNRG